MVKRDEEYPIYTGFLLETGDCIKGEDVSLVLDGLHPKRRKKGYVPSYMFSIIRNDTGERAGSLSLRLGTSEYLNRYIGHVGYSVELEHRGHYFAMKGCRLLKGLALRHGFRSLYITCDPDNVASRKTIEKLGATFISEEVIPRHTPLYRQGSRRKLRYEWKLS